MAHAHLLPADQPGAHSPHEQNIHTCLARATASALYVYLAVAFVNANVHSVNVHLFITFINTSVRERLPAAACPAPRPRPLRDQRLPRRAGPGLPLPLLRARASPPSASPPQSLLGVAVLHAPSPAAGLPPVDCPSHRALRGRDGRPEGGPGSRRQGG